MNVTKFQVSRQRRMEIGKDMDKEKHGLFSTLMTIS